MPDFEGARRLAQLDIERHGLAEVHVQGGRDEPFYTNMTVVPYGTEMPLEEYLRLESRFHALTPGGHLVKIPLRDSEVEAESLFSETKKITREHKIGLYTYDRSLTYCSNCRRTFLGGKIKCPTCGSVNAITKFRREPARYQVTPS